MRILLQKMFQDWNQYVIPCCLLSVMTLVFLGVFFISQIPSILESKLASLLLSLCMYTVLSIGMFVLGRIHNSFISIPVYTLIIATITMFPVPWKVSGILVIVLTITQLLYSAAGYEYGLDYNFYIKVRLISSSKMK